MEDPAGHAEEEREGERASDVNLMIYFKNLAVGDGDDDDGADAPEKKRVSVEGNDGGRGRCWTSGTSSCASRRRRTLNPTTCRAGSGRGSRTPTRRTCSGRRNVKVVYIETGYYVGLA
ncbi:hypothetical protein DL767_003649 [Monosporascus sp. MG133]|nr:hypothetical protein DL767_003649 [Monosporascus sp. MG133]